MRKNVIFEWSFEYEETFKRLKNAVISVSVLRHFDKSKLVILKADSSNYVIDKIFSQYNDNGALHSVAFYSKNLTLIECNYQIYDKELLAIIRYLKHWRPKLECTEIFVKIFTDYKGFIYFAEGRDLSRRQTRYLNILFEFNIKIIYQPDPQNVKADVLTRIVGFKLNSSNNERLQHQYQTIFILDRLELDGINLSIYNIIEPIFHIVAIANIINDFYSEICNAIAKSQDKHHNVNLIKCSIRDDVLYHKNRL